MKDLLQYIVDQIVDNKEKIAIKEKEENDGLVLLELTVAPEDMGKVIGKSGKIINAIRQILRVKAVKEGKKVALKLIDQSQKDSPAPPVPPEEHPPLSQTEPTGPKALPRQK